MSTTMNGWPKDPPVVRIFVGGDTSGAKVATGDVARVFTEFLTRFHTEVEPIREVHGFRTSAFNATLAGAARNSNHVSGTAVDVNGNRHPNENAHGGARLASGFDVGQTASLRRLLAEFPVLGWGGDFPIGKRDYMHFEVVASVIPASTPPVHQNATEVPIMRLIRIREDGRIILVGPTLFEKIPDGDIARAEALKAIYGPWTEVSIADGRRIHEQVIHNIEVTAKNLRAQWQLVGGPGL